MSSSLIIRHYCYPFYKDCITLFYRNNFVSSSLSLVVLDEILYSVFTSDEKLMITYHQNLIAVRLKIAATKTVNRFLQVHRNYNFLTIGYYDYLIASFATQREFQFFCWPTNETNT